MLRVENLVRSFGGIKATDNLSLDVVPGELHAIIGPNGAGKTTLISQLTGQLMPNSGAIHFAGRDVTRLPSYQRSRLGLARSFQITCLLPDFTAADNVALAAQAHDGHSFRFWGAARKEKHLRDAAQAALDAGRAREARRRAGVRTEPRRTARTRARGGARDKAAIAAARRADGRASASPNPRAWWRC